MQQQQRRRMGRAVGAEEERDRGGDREGHRMVVGRWSGARWRARAGRRELDGAS
jgi:hypothetical protein